MEQQEQNTEQIILDAAEAEFLETGFGNTKVISIAKRAGVSHSMLNYYFRSKEKLFQVVFESKVQKVSFTFEDIFSQQLPFDQTIRKFIETQFDFIAQNPKLPYFIITEVINNKANRDLLFDALSSKVKVLASQFKLVLQAEIDKGAIRPMQFEELLMNIASINVFTFIALPIVTDILPMGQNVEMMLAHRKESNVQFILNSLRP